jgi:Na+/H+ antiporter NhaD/arsenite permease-like protein
LYLFLKHYPFTSLCWNDAFISNSYFVGEILSSRQFSIHNPNESTDENSHSSSPIFRALSKIEMPSILFFLGILMTVAALESLGIVFNLGKNVQESIPINFFVILLGFGSAVIDNVPLVAASMGMFDLAIDNPLFGILLLTLRVLEEVCLSLDLLLELLQWEWKKYLFSGI